MPNLAKYKQALRRYTAPGVWVVALGILGALVAGTFGAIVGVFISLAWVFFALAGADRYAIVIHNGRLLNRIEAPNLHEIVDELAAGTGIEAPSLYALPFNEPNIVVCAGGPQSGRPRIGLTRGLALNLDREEVRALLALAFARIGTGDAAVISLSSTLAGLPQQLAMSPTVNFTAGDWLTIDPECGLTPIGKAVLLVTAPISWLANKLGGVGSGCVNSDMAALRYLGDGEVLARALEKAAESIPVVDSGSTAGYNPATAPAFLVSPFEGTRGLSPEPAERPLWQKARVWISRQTPPVRVRADLLRGEWERRPQYGTAERPEIGPHSRAEHVTWPPTG